MGGQSPRTGEGQQIMVKSKQKKEVPTKRRNAAIRVQRRRSTNKVHATTTISTSSTSRQRSASALCGIATTSNNNKKDDSSLTNNELRTMRKERRDLLQQLATFKKERDDNEHKLLSAAENDSRDLIQQLTAVKKERDDIKQQSVEQLEKLENERDTSKQLLQKVENERDDAIEQSAQLKEKTESIVTTAEKHVLDALRKAEIAEEERDILLKNDTVVYDEGTGLWQNVWSKTNVSTMLSFPTTKSAMCSSVEVQHSGNSMPGVHALGVIDSGRTTQSIWMKGSGYTLVGLVTNEAEKNQLCYRAGDDWSKLPWMTVTSTYGNDESQGDILTIEVDMIERRAKLYISDKDASHQLEPFKVWENIPDKVWVAIAFKRNSSREAVLMPCIHWKIQD